MAIALALVLATGVKADITVPLAELNVPVSRLRLDVDTRPDIDGMQTEMAAVMQVPFAIATVVSGAAVFEEAAFKVSGELTGPEFTTGPLTLSATANEPFLIPGLRLPGRYRLQNVRLENASGEVLLRRDPRAAAVTVQVVEKLLVTEVTSKTLSREEIEERGIVIDEGSFAVVDFTIGIAIGSQEVVVDVPLLVPQAGAAIGDPGDLAVEGLSLVSSGFEDIPIPNLSIAGFSLSNYDCPADRPGCAAGMPRLPPVHGVIVIPGDIGFLHEFFSVMVMASNVAADGSGLVVRDLVAVAEFPVGEDGIAGSGDDPLALAATESSTNTATQALLSPTGAGALSPKSSASAEYLVEGKKEGTHLIGFALRGLLHQPGLAEAIPITGRAAGVVLVKNPTFDIVLAHPQVVLAGEPYTLFATVTNTSSSPANAFRLALHRGSLSGATFAEDEIPWRKVESLAAGDSRTFRYALVARRSGKVTGTVLLADEGVQGSFLLTTGVGTGGAASPTTLLLPDWVSSLPADVIDSSVRLLSQGYSAATMPFGSPPPYGRIDKPTVRAMASRFALVGLYQQFGQPSWRSAADLLMDMLMVTTQPLDSPIAASDESALAMARLRRSSAAGADWQQALGRFVAASTADMPGGVEAWQREVAASYASFHGATSVYINLPAAQVSLSTASDNAFQASLPLGEGQLLVLARPTDGEELLLEARQTTAAKMRLSIAVSGVQLIYELPLISAGGFASVRLDARGPLLSADSDGDGAVDMVLPAAEILSLAERGPQLASVMQWGSGSSPALYFDQAQGDPFGGLVAAVFDEPLAEPLASNFEIGDNTVLGAALQSGGRLVLLATNKPVGHLLDRTLYVEACTDILGTTSTGQSAPLLSDPRQGAGGVVEGTVRLADGTPVPFAVIDYMQPKSCIDCPPGSRLYANDDHVISRFTADAHGRYSLDFVLRNNVISDRPDRWLNRLYNEGTNHYKLEATDPFSGQKARASSRVQYDGQRIFLDLLVRGSASLDGRILDESGAAYVAGAGQPVVAESVSGGSGGVTWIDVDGSYAFPWRSAEQEAPLLSVGNVTLGVRHNSRYGVTSVNLPYAGARVKADVQMHPLSRFGSLRGVLLEAGGEVAAAGVAIELRAAGFAGPVALDTATDSRGGFEFSEVPEGSVRLRAVRLVSAEQVGASTFVQGGQRRDVVMLLPGSGGRVRGFVVDAVGDLVPLAEVVGARSRTQADEFGAFELVGLPVGRFTVYAADPLSPAIGTRAVEIFRADELLEITIALEPTGQVQGVVFEADATTPIAGQAVQLWSATGMRAQALADDNGQYSFDNLPLDSYQVRAATGEYGDGGIAQARVSFVGQVQNANIVFRGRSRIVGRVLQDSGTPAVADVLLRGPVWRLIPVDGGATAAFKDSLEDFDTGDIASSRTIRSFANKLGSVAKLFVVRDEWFLTRSDQLGDAGAVTGRFSYEGFTGGPYAVSAFGPFYAPATVSGLVPRAPGSAIQSVDVGDIVLTPSTGEVHGMVTLPDGLTPVGAGVRVRLRTVGNFGYEIGGQTIPQAADAELEAFTDTDGNYSFPLAFAGPCELTADTGTPLLGAASGADIVTDNFAGLNVRLYGRAKAVLPAGRVLAVELRLAGGTALDVRVVGNDGLGAVPAAQLSLRTVSPVDTDPLSAVADNAGEYTFLPVTEGLATIAARDPVSGASGWVNVRVASPPLAGGMPITVKIGAVLNAAGEETPATLVGAVSGTVFRADGSPVRHPTEVRVTSAAADFLTVTGVGGGFALNEVPIGAITVRAFEPFTGRSGSTTAVLSSDGMVANVSLVGLGTVSGRVRFADNTTPVPGAALTLTPGGRQFTNPLRTLAASDGTFVFPGVPEGPFRIDGLDLASRLRGSAAARVSEDGEVVDITLTIVAHGSIAGHVYTSAVRVVDGAPYDDAGVAWPTAPTAAAARITISQDQRIVRLVQSAADGAFDSGPYLPTGTYHLRVDAAAGDDGAQMLVDIAEHGQRAAASLALVGIGAVEGVVTDAAGLAAVQGVQVLLHSESPFAAGDRSVVSGADGGFRFTGVALGRFGLTLETTVGTPALGAAVTDSLDSPGQTVAFANDDEDLSRSAIALESAAGVRGVVLAEDGLTPAADAVLTVSSSRVQQVRTTDRDGRFAWAGLPLGEYMLTVTHPASGGLVRQDFALSGNAVAMDLGTMVLDATAPTLTTRSPAVGAFEVSTTDAIVLNFSEAVEAASVAAETFSVMVAGQSITGSRTVAADGLSATFQPVLPWPDRARVGVVLWGDRVDLDGNLIAAGIRDLAGHGLGQSPIRWHFATADATAPTTVSTFPANGATGVLLASPVRFQFSEAMSAALVSNLQVIDVDTGAAVPGRAALIQGDSVLSFVSSTPFAANRSYRAFTSGTDQAGIALVGGASTSFSTIDTQGPVVDTLNVVGSAIRGARVRLAAQVSAPDLALVEFFVDGELLGSVGTPPWEMDVGLDPVATNASSRLAAVAVDKVGNRGPPRELLLPIATNSPPSIVFELPMVGATADPGATVSVSLLASDDVAVRQIGFTVNDGAIAAESTAIAGSDTTVYQQGYGFVVPLSATLGDSLMLRASVVDSLGQRATAEFALALADTAGPSVAVTSPTPATLLVPGQPFTVVVSARDKSGLTSLGLQASGEVSFSESRPGTGSATDALESFVLILPPEARASAFVVLTARGTDRLGNVGTGSTSISIADVTGPVLELRPVQPVYQPGESVAVEALATDDLAVAEIEISGAHTITLRPLPATDVVAETFVFTVPANAALGDILTLTGFATDTSNNVGLTVQTSITVGDRSAPSVSIASPARGASADPRVPLEVEVRASDSLSLRRIELSWTGVSNGAQSRAVVYDGAEALAVTELFSVAWPVDLRGGELLNLQATAVDAAGHVGTGTSRNVFALDVVSPQVVRHLPAEASSVVGTAPIEIEFDEAIRADTITNANFVVVSGATAVSGQVKLDSPTLVRFVADAPLGLGVYNVSAAGITDVAGNVMAGLDYTFQVDSLAPQVLKVAHRASDPPLVHYDSGGRTTAIELNSTDFTPGNLQLILGVLTQHDIYTLQPTVMRTIFSVVHEGLVHDFGSQMGDAGETGVMQAQFMWAHRPSATTRYTLDPQAFGNTYTTFNHALLGLDLDSAGFVHGRDYLLNYGGVDRPSVTEFTPDGESSYLVLAFSQDTTWVDKRVRAELVVYDDTAGVALYRAGFGSAYTNWNHTFVGGVVLEKPPATRRQISAHSQRGGVNSPGYSWLNIIRLDAFESAQYLQTVGPRTVPIADGMVDSLAYTADAAGKIITLGFVQTDAPSGLSDFSALLEREGGEILYDSTQVVRGGISEPRSSPGHFYLHAGNYPSGSSQATTLRLMTPNASTMQAHTLVAFGTVLRNRPRRDPSDTTRPTAALSRPAPTSVVGIGRVVDFTVRIADDSTLDYVALRIENAGRVTLLDSRLSIGAPQAIAGVEQSFSWVVPAETVDGSTIAVTANVADAQGNGFSTAALLLTAADIDAPAVLSRSPATGATVGRGPLIEIRYDEALSPASVSAATVSLRAAGFVTGAVVLADLDTRIQFIPEQPLQMGVTYEVRIVGVQDVAGNSAAPLSFAFEVTVL